MSYRPKVKIIFKNGTTKILDGNYIKSFSCSENITDINISITPGFCEQYADITFYDRDNYFHNASLSNGLGESTVELYEVEDGVENLLGRYVIAKWDIEGDSTDIKITCKDFSYLFESLTVVKDEIANRTLSELLGELFSGLPGVSFQFVDGETQTRCEAIRAIKSYHNDMSFKDMLNKLCYLGMLRVYFKNNIFYIARCV